MLKNKFKILAVIVIACFGLGCLVGGFAYISKADGENITVEDGGELNIYNQGGPSGDLGGTTNYDDLVVDSITVNGAVAATGAISGTNGTLSGTLDVSGESDVEGFTDGSGALQLATSTGTTNISQTQLLTDSYLEVMVNSGATASLQLPASSTWTTLIPTESKHRSWVIHNATSSTMALTILAGAGMDLIGVTTNDDVIDETEYAELECWRQPDTDITCRVSELLHVD